MYLEILVSQRIHGMQDASRFLHTRIPTCLYEFSLEVGSLDAVARASSARRYMGLFRPNRDAAAETNSTSEKARR
jgi:hypothetical protein